MYEGIISYFKVTIIHECAEATLIGAGNGFYHPYTRWFNDGVAQWINRRIIRESWPDEPNLYDKYWPNPAQMNFNSQINLLSWLQLTFEKDLGKQASSPVYYYYAEKLISNLFDDQPDDALPRVIAIAGKKKNPNTDDLCNVIRSVTNKDPKSALLKYVPDEIRLDLSENRPKLLTEQARCKASSRNYAGVIDDLKKILEITPDDASATFNLTWALRKLHRPESEPYLLIASRLTTEMKDIKPYSDDIDAAYLKGRLCQRWGNFKEARMIFNGLLKSDKHYIDASNALKELKSHTD